MIVRAIDTDGDWLFGKGRNDFRRNQDAIQQCIQTRCLSFLGNCFFDAGAGIDWFNYLGGSKDQSVLNLAISATILNTPGNVVTGIQQISIALDHETRRFAVSYRVQTVYSVLSGTFSFDPNGVA